MLRPLLLILAWWMVLFAPVNPAHAEEPEARSTSVYVGVYLRDISQFDLEDGRFQADLDAWMKWAGDADPPPLRFVNGELQTKEVVEREADGDWHSVRWHVQGTFRGQFDLHEFPYDRQPIEIVVELPGEDQQGTDGRVFQLLPDAAASGMAADFSLTGWLYERAFTVRQLQTRLASDLGSIRHEGQATVGQAVAFRVVMARPFTSYLIKFLLPLGIIVVLSMTVFWVEESNLEVRASIGVTGVLSCIAFHFTQADTLPDVAYLVRADHLFLLAYLCVALALVETLLVHWYEVRGRAVAHFLDVLSRLLFPLAFLAATGIILWPPADVGPSELEVATSPDRPEIQSHDEQGMTFTSDTPAAHRSGLTWRYAGGRFGNLPVAVSEPPLLLEMMPAVSNDLVRFLPDGGMEVTWRLRAGLRWSDGHAMDSGDLAFTMATLPEGEHGQVEVMEERAVRVRWPNRSAAHLRNFRLLPEHALADAWKEGPEALDTAEDQASTPGDGPFTFAEHREDGVSVFRRNPHFAGTPTRLSEFAICFGRSSACNDRTRITYFPFLSRRTLSAIIDENEEVRELTVDRGPRMKQYLFYAVVAGLPELQTAEARRLVLGTFDRAALVEAEPAGTVTDSFADVPGLPAPTPYDPEAARALLSRFGPERPLPVFCRDISGGPDVLACATVVDGLRAAGATVELKKVSYEERRQLAREGGLVGLVVLQQSGDPMELLDNAWAILESGGHNDWGRSYSPAWTSRQQALAEVVRTSLYRERRDVAMAALARQHATELPTLVLMRVKAASAWDARLRGPRPEFSDSYAYLEDWYTISPEQLERESTPELPATQQLTR